MSLLHLQFRGLDEGTDPKTQPPGSLVEALNCRMDKSRRLHKRWGTDGLPKTIVGGGSISEAERLFQAADGGIGLITGDSAYVYNTAATSWQLLDRVTPWIGTRRPLIDHPAGVQCMEAALYQDLLISVWCLGSKLGTVGEIYVQIHDVETWSMVLPPLRLDSSAAHPKVLVIGTTAYVVWQDTDIEYCTINLTTFAVSAVANLVTGSVASSPFDIASDGTSLYVAYLLAAGADRIRVDKITAGSSVANYSAGGAVTSANFEAICIDVQEYVQVAWSETGTGSRLVTTTTGLANVAGPTTVNATAGNQVFAVRHDATNLLFGWQDSGTGGAFKTKLVGQTTHVDVANTTYTTYDGIESCSRPFKYESKWYTSVLVAVDDSDQEAAGYSRVLIEIPTAASTTGTMLHVHVATIENQTGWRWESDKKYLPRVPTDAFENPYILSTWRHAEGNRSSTLAAGVNVTKLTRGGVTSDRFRMLSAGNTRMLVTAAPGIYDGSNFEPAGYVHPPMIDATVDNGAATGSMGAGAYQYAVVFVRAGADGVLQRSIPSGIVEESTSGTGSITISFVSTGLSVKFTGTQHAGALGRTYAEIYRSTAGGSILYRLTLVPVEFDYGAYTGSYTDTLADSNIGDGQNLDTQPQIYVDTELEDEPPPAATTGTVHKNRIFLIASDEFTVVASKDVSEDLAIAPGFNGVLALQFATRKKALASLDEKLVAFGDDDIDIVHGDGPSSNGDENTWSISRLQTDVGCVNPRSVVVTPFGVIFESRRGLEMLDRGLNVSPIGQAVEDKLASYPTITSAVLVAEEGEVRFTCNDTAGASGIVIVWDYINKFWHTRKYKDAADTDATETAFVDAALIGGVYTLVTAAGQVYREDTSTFLDDGTDFVERDVQLAAVSPAGPNGWHRFRRWQVLGTNVTNHDLKLSLARDYATTWEQTNTFAAQTTPTTIGPIQQARITPQYQKATAMRLRLQDITPTTGAAGTGAGPIWEAVTLDYDVKRGTARTSAAEQA